MMSHINKRGNTEHVPRPRLVDHARPDLAGLGRVTLSEGKGKVPLWTILPSIFPTNGCNRTFAFGSLSVLSRFVCIMSPRHTVEV